MNIVVLSAHSILEYDELRILHALGHSVLSIGAYLDPAQPSDDKRPALPDIPAAPAELRALLADQMAAKSDLPPEVIEWADVVICYFFPDSAPEGRAGWLAGPNWPKLKGKRVIWRTVGQSNASVEHVVRLLRAQGLQIVRYSPREQHIPDYAGHDAIIRFAKDPAEWHGWHGSQPVVGNITQNLYQRGAACGYPFWVAATDGLQTAPAGPGSDVIGGVGPLAYDDMRAYLRRIRAYLYTGTQPAPYTLGLIEAMMTGVPVLSIGPHAFGARTWMDEVFEGHQLTLCASDDPLALRRKLAELLEYRGEADELSELQRPRAVALFGVDTIREQWAEFLGPA